MDAKWCIRLWDWAAVLLISAGLTYRFAWPGGAVPACLMLVSGLLAANTARLGRKAQRR